MAPSLQPVQAAPWVPVDPTLVVSRDYAKLARARMAGLTTEATNILSDYAVKDMDLAGMGSLIACTPEDEVNATAFQPSRSDDELDAMVAGGLTVKKTRLTAEFTFRESERCERTG